MYTLDWLGLWTYIFIYKVQTIISYQANWFGVRPYCFNGNEFPIQKKHRERNNDWASSHDREFFFPLGEFFSASPSYFRILLYSILLNTLKKSQISVWN